MFNFAAQICRDVEGIREMRDILDLQLSKAWFQQILHTRYTPSIGRAETLASFFKKKKNETRPFLIIPIWQDCSQHSSVASVKFTILPITHDKTHFNSAFLCFFQVDCPEVLKALLCRLDTNPHIKLPRTGGWLKQIKAWLVCGCEFPQHYQKDNFIFRISLPRTIASIKMQKSSIKYKSWVAEMFCVQIHHHKDETPSSDPPHVQVRSILIFRVVTVGNT